MQRDDHGTTGVLVVGAGPVGLSLAIELGRRGIRTTVVEAGSRVGRSPRAKTTNVRSMEHLRRWGIADAVRAASPMPEGYANRAVFATGMFGHMITAFDNINYTDRVRDERFSEAGQWIPQYAVEDALLAAARALPAVTVRMATELTGFEADADGVTATVGGGGSIRARYLVGADGARSTVRGLLGIAMEGAGNIGTFVTYILRIPGLAAAHALGDGLMYWMVNPASPGILGPMDVGDTWFWGTQVPPDAVPDEAAMRARIATSMGRDMPFEVLAHDVWVARKLLAQSYGGGRVYLAGDACHLHPPFGGYGMNLGIADAVDLGWKIAADLQGWGGPALLASYEAERRPVHQRVIDAAVENMALLAQHFGNPAIAADGLEGEAARAATAAAIRAGKEREFNSLGLVLGYAYGGSPIVVPDGSPEPVPEVTSYTPDARPGNRAPHGWMADGRSLFDLFGEGFTLLAFGGDPAPMVEAAAARDVPLTVVCPGSPDLAARYRAPFALIRPDQHVAWRGDDLADAGRILDTARGAN